MRILYVTDVCFPRVNGVSTSIESFRRELAAAGHHVLVVGPRYGEERQAPGFLRLPARRVPFDPEDRLLRTGALLSMADDFRRRRLDLIHVQTPFVAHWDGIRLARRLGIPVVTTYHTHFEQYLHHYVPFVPRPLLAALARRASRRQCHQTQAVVVPSTAFRDVLRGYGVGTRMEVIPTGLDLTRFRGGDGAAFRRAHGIAAERPVLLHVGRMAHEKNIPFLLEVAAAVRRELPSTLLVMAGEGPARRSLERRAAALGLGDDAVRWLGYLDREGALLDCYRAADAFFFASRTETQGLVLLEAMALGVPVVSTAVLGTRDVLAAREGALVAPEEVGPFAAEVLRLLRDRPLATGLGRAGAAHVRDRWSAPACAAKMIELYAEVVARSQPAAAAA
jgi:1,2-diacylglycerol 3-alpha-glucosyltransferase